MRLSIVTSAVVAALVGFGSTIAIIIAAARAVGADADQTASWVAALCLSMALTSAVLSIRYRMPVVTAWSTPGAALIAATSGISLRAAVGAFLLAGALIVLAGAVRPFGRLIERIPAPIAAAMLAGILIRFVMAVFESAGAKPGLVLPLVVIFLAARLVSPPAAVLAVLVAGFALAFGGGFAGPLPQGLEVSTLVFVPPVFEPAILLGLGVPLFLVTMASQNLPGFAVLRASGYSPAPAPDPRADRPRFHGQRRVRGEHEQPRGDLGRDLHGTRHASRSGPALAGRPGLCRVLPGLRGVRRFPHRRDHGPSAGADPHHRRPRPHRVVHRRPDGGSGRGGQALPGRPHPGGHGLRPVPSRDRIRFLGTGGRTCLSWPRPGRRPDAPPPLNWTCASVTLKTSLMPHADRGMSMAGGIAGSAAGRGSMGSRLAATLLIAGLAACQGAGEVSSRAGGSPEGVPIVLESIDGAPAPVRTSFVNELTTAAANRKVEIVGNGTDARYRVRGYLSTETTEGETSVAYVWDVFDAQKKRAQRLAGSSPVRVASWNDSRSGDPGEARGVQHGRDRRFSRGLEGRDPDPDGERRGRRARRDGPVTRGCGRTRGPMHDRVALRPIFVL